MELLVAAIIVAFFFVFLHTGAEKGTTLPSAAAADHWPSATHWAHEPPHQCSRPGKRSHAQVWVNTRRGFAPGFIILSLVTLNLCVCGKPCILLYVLEWMVLCRKFFVLFRLIWNLQCKCLHLYHSTISHLLSTCPVRLVNALLSTCRRQHLALKAASITTDDAEWEELERLVHRERGVVWADQEKAEDRDDGGTGSTHLQPILSFSHLVSHQSTPCSEWNLDEIVKLSN